MFRKTLLSGLVLIAMTACGAIGNQPTHAESESASVAQHEAILAKAPHPNLIGTEEWYVWVEEAVGVTDGQGHGPDHGSTEWCHAVHYKVFGFRADETVTCEQTWERQVDRALRLNRGILNIF